MATKPFPWLSPAVLLPRNGHCSSNSGWHGDARVWQWQGASGRVPCVTRCHAPFGLLLSLEMSQPLRPGHCGLPWAWGLPWLPSPPCWKGSAPPDCNFHGEDENCGDSWQAACTGMRAHVVKGPSETVGWQIPVITILIHLL